MATACVRCACGGSVQQRGQLTSTLLTVYMTIEAVEYGGVQVRISAQRGREKRDGDTSA